jgi:hypothetical protein
MRSNTARDGAESLVGSILHPCANAHSALAGERPAAGRMHLRPRMRYQFAISPTNFINSFSTSSLLTCEGL